MISRRNIRVKVMQSLYALRNSPSLALKPGEAANLLTKHFDSTLALLTWQIWFLTEVARYAETDARLRAAKHLPTEADLNVPVKIAGNEVLWRMLESGFLTAAVGKYLVNPALSKDWVRRIYLLLIDSTPYQFYNTEPRRDKKADREIIEFIYTDLMLANDDFTEFAEELYNNWDDDAELLSILALQFIQKPQVFLLDDMVGKEKFDFAKNLMETTEQRKGHLAELIKPKLRNWEADRLAQLDLIILEMAVCEFLYFETIPAKVTINEYIDLAKAYSTNQSGQFVNGILDNIRKDLEQTSAMHKVAFRKQ
jgi:transcription antitermination protein NusB